MKVKINSSFLSFIKGIFYFWSFYLRGFFYVNPDYFDQSNSNIEAIIDYQSKYLSNLIIQENINIPNLDK
jgi:hypothetical protein